jgi:hypothetical protein
MDITSSTRWMRPRRLLKILVRLGVANAECDDLDSNILDQQVGGTEKLY